MSHAPTLQDVLEAVNTFATNVDGQFREIRQEVGEIKKDIVNIKEENKGMRQDIKGMKQEIRGMKEEITGIKQDISGMKKDISGLKQEMSEVKQEMSEVKQDMSGMKKDIESLKSKASFIETNMVTKDHFDKKLTELRNELVLFTQRSNTKLTVLIEELVAQKALTIDTARKILALEPFPHA